MFLIDFCYDECHIFAVTIRPTGLLTPWLSEATAYWLLRIPFEISQALNYPTFLPPTRSKDCHWTTVTWEVQMKNNW